MNTTTVSIFELENHKVLIILKDGTNLTSWEDVQNKKDIIYVSEDLSDRTDLSYKYQDLESLKAIVTPEISDKVTDMREMFYDCSSLKDIVGLENWNTGQVTDRGSMFCGCTSLVDLSMLSNWDISNADKKDIFLDCNSVNAYPTWDERGKTP